MIISFATQSHEAPYMPGLLMTCHYIDNIRILIYDHNTATMPQYKTEYLRNSGTLNHHPEKVSDPLFIDSPFFDPLDLLQVRYEMVRCARQGTPLKETAARFGTSVPTCVRANRAFQGRGLQGLIPERRGPRGPHKITPEMLHFVQEYRAEHGPVGVRKLARVISEHFGITIHFTGLHKALEKKPRSRTDDATS